jgi:hypothetical protein
MKINIGFLPTTQKKKKPPHLSNRTIFFPKGKMIRVHGNNVTNKKTHKALENRSPLSYKLHEASKSWDMASLL